MYIWKIFEFGSKSTVLYGVVDMDVGYKASDQGLKHYSGFFLFHFILHNKVGLKLFFM